MKGVEELLNLLGEEYSFIKMDKRGNIIFSNFFSSESFLDAVPQHERAKVANLIYGAILNGKAEDFISIKNGGEKRYFFRFILKDDEIWGIGKIAEEIEADFKTDFMGNVIQASDKWKWMEGKNIFDVMENEEKLVEIISKAIEEGEKEEKGEINGRKVLIKIRATDYLEFFIRDDIEEMAWKIATSGNEKKLIENVRWFIESLSYKNYEIEIGKERMVKEGNGEYFIINFQNGFAKIYGKRKRELDILPAAISLAFEKLKAKPIMEAIPVCTVGRDGKILSINKKFSEIMGYGEEIIGKNVNEFAPHPSFSDGTRKWKRKYGEIWVKEVVVKKGDEIYLFLHDFTKEKEKMDENDFLNSLLRHDIPNKNQIALGYIGLLEKTKLSKKQREYIEKAKKGLEECNDLIQSVRKLGEIKKERRIKKMRVGKIIQEVCKSLEEEAKKHGMKIDCNVKNFVIRADDLIKEVFFNIIKNAIEHSRSRNLKIYGRGSNGKREIIFEDDGIGIPEKFLGDVFKPGWRHNSKGSGLGLYIVKKLMERYGGSVKIESMEGKGTKVILQFMAGDENFLKIRL